MFLILKLINIFSNQFSFLYQNLNSKTLETNFTLGGATDNKQNNLLQNTYLQLQCYKLTVL